MQKNVYMAWRLETQKKKSKCICFFEVLGYTFLEISNVNRLPVTVLKT